MLDGETVRIADKEQLFTQIHREDELMSQRIGWFGTSQSFLVVAFTILLGQQEPKLEVLMLILPFVGLLITIVVGLSLFAAFLTQELMLKELRKVWQDEGLLPLDKEWRYGLRWEYWVVPRPRFCRYLGFLPVWVFPMSFLIFWSLVLLLNPYDGGFAELFYGPSNSHEARGVYFVYLG